MRCRLCKQEKFRAYFVEEMMHSFLPPSSSTSSLMGGVLDNQAFRYPSLPAFPCGHAHVHHLLLVVVLGLDFRQVILGGHNASRSLLGAGCRSTKLRGAFGVLIVQVGRVDFFLVAIGASIVLVVICGFNVFFIIGFCGSSSLALFGLGGGYAGVWVR